MKDDQDEPALKRRKLTQASRILARPFISPLKTSARPPKSLQHSTSDVQSVSSGKQASAPGEHASPSSVLNDRSTPAPSSSLSSTHEKDSQQERTETSSLTNDRGLSHEIRLLEIQIRAVRGDIDTLERAAAFRSSGSNERLAQLSSKWRGVAQAAADELFPTVKERLAGMGGMAAWRESERVKHSYGQQDKQTEVSNMGDHTHDRQLEQHGGSPVSQDVAASEDDFTNAESPDPSTESDETFNMGMMLRSLNVDFDLIGYDVTSQTWLKEEITTV